MRLSSRDRQPAARGDDQRRTRKARRRLAAADDPAGPATGSFRTIREGGWLNPAVQNRSAQRVDFDPSLRYCLLSGFRVASDAP